MRKEEKSEITRTKILQAAENEFSEKGFFGARVDEIALASGVNKRMIYAHFENKSGLYRAVLISVYKRLAECEREFCVEEAAPDVAIKNSVLVGFRFLKENPAFVRMLMWENLSYAYTVSSEELQSTREPTISYLKRQIARGISLGIFKEGIDEYQVALSVLSFPFAYFSNIHTFSKVFGKNMRDATEIEKRAEFVAEIILQRLLK